LIITGVKAAKSGLGFRTHYLVLYHRFTILSTLSRFSIERINPRGPQSRIFLDIFSGPIAECRVLAKTLEVDEAAFGQRARAPRSVFSVIPANP
jgi:hypothetical protein